MGRSLIKGKNTPDVLPPQLSTFLTTPKADALLQLWAQKLKGKNDSRSLMTTCTSPGPPAFKANKPVLVYAGFQLGLPEERAVDSGLETTETHFLTAPEAGRQTKASAGRFPPRSLCSVRTCRPLPVSSFRACLCPNSPSSYGVRAHPSDLVFINRWTL